METFNRYYIYPYLNKYPYLHPSPCIVKYRDLTVKSQNPRVPGEPSRGSTPNCSSSSLPLAILFHRGHRKGSLQAHATVSHEQIPPPPPRAPLPILILPGARGEPPDMAPAAPDGGAESQRQADLLKQEGNAFFRKERLSAAIDAYTGVSLPAWRTPPLPAAWFACCALAVSNTSYIQASFLFPLFNRCVVEWVTSVVCSILLSAAARLVRPADKFSESMLNYPRLLPEYCWVVTMAWWIGLWCWHSCSEWVTWYVLPLVVKKILEDWRRLPVGRLIFWALVRWFD